MSPSTPYLIATIDVEEDHWGFDAGRDSEVENLRMLPQLQSLFDRYRVRPTYLISHPVASRPWAVEILAGMLASGKCEIGSHLHPWNTPPFTEELSERNSMLKNLPPELQTEKLRTLTAKIESAFGSRPVSFRAGRWALGPETVKALIACGYRTDCSVTPTMSWSHYGDGARYDNAMTEPYWLSLDGKKHEPGQAILEVPATIGFNRWPFQTCHHIQLQLQQNWMRFFRPIGLMHHTGILRKIWLSPEINSAEDMIVLARILVNNGMRCLNLSFHSTTLMPGRSPFVKNSTELEQFHRKIETLLEYVMSSLHASSLTLSEVQERISLLPDAGPQEHPGTGRFAFP